MLNAIASSTILSPSLLLSKTLAFLFLLLTTAAQMKRRLLVLFFKFKNNCKYFYTSPQRDFNQKSLFSSFNKS